MVHKRFCWWTLHKFCRQFHQTLEYLICFVDEYTTVFVTVHRRIKHEVLQSESRILQVQIAWLSTWVRAKSLFFCRDNKTLRPKKSVPVGSKVQNFPCSLIQVKPVIYYCLCCMDWCDMTIMRLRGIVKSWKLAVCAQPWITLFIVNESHSLQDFPLEHYGLNLDWQGSTPNDALLVNFFKRLQIVTTVY